jgi:hypothetical protein
MRRTSTSVCLCLFVLALFAAEAPALEIQVAPSTINKQSCGGSFSIHTDIPYSLAIGPAPGVLVSVAVNGSDLTCWKKPDSCGNLVLKASLDTVKEMIDPPSATVTVTADFVITGKSETASETITVVDVSGKRK